MSEMRGTKNLKITFKTSLLKVKVSQSRVANFIQMLLTREGKAISPENGAT